MSTVVLDRVRLRLLDARLPRASDAFVGAAVFIPYLLVRAVAVWPSRDTTGNWYGDQLEYLRVSRLPIGTQFVTEHKPWGYPLFLKLLQLGGALDGLVLVQLALSVAAWSVLAYVVATEMRRRWVGRCSAIAVLLFSASWPVAQWDTLPLSESVSLSLFALLLAALIRLVRNPSWSTTAAVVAAACAFTSIRDTNAPFAAFLLAGTAVLTLRRTRRYAIVGAVTAAVLVAATAAGAGVHRWEVLVADQIGKRAMLDPEMHRYFVGAGMPSRPDLSAVIWSDTRTFPDPATVFEHDPRLASFMPWFMTHGRTTYDAYLLTHPKRALVDPIRRLPTTIDTAGLVTYHDDDYRPAVRGPLGALAYPASGASVALWTAIALVLGIAAAAGRVAGRRFALPLLLLASVAPLQIVVWDGEPSEVPRHALLVGASARLGLLLLVLLAADAVVARRRGGAT